VRTPIVPGWNGPPFFRLRPGRGREMKPKKVIAWRRRAAAAEELAREAQLIAHSVEFQKIAAEALVKELRGLRFEVQVLRDELRSR